MKNIVLTGFMGAGKSSVGKKLSEMLGLAVVDTDDVIEKDSGMDIEEIFSRLGEVRFREMEKEAVKKVSSLKNHIIITGGGVVLDKENLRNLRKNGVIVFLHASPETIYNRVRNETHRPLLQVKNPLEKIVELLEYRESFYANNDLQIDTENLSITGVAEEIKKRLEI